MANQYVADLIKVLNDEKPKEMPIVFWGGAPFSTSLVGVKEIDYYQNIELKLQTFTKMFELLPEAVFFPGFWPDYGATTLPSAFGSELIWQERESPFAKPALHSVADIDKLKPADPYKSGLMPTCLKEWEYFWQHVDKKWIDDYGYLDGVGWIMGPVESAAQIRGYSDFFLEMCMYPEKIHKLLEIVTDGAVAYLKAQEKINGKLKRIFIGDHIPTQISPAHFQEFFVPYIKRIFDEFHYAEIKGWHNEGLSSHVLAQIPDMGCNIWQFGDDDPEKAKEVLKGRVVLMGNLHPVHHLLNLSPEEIDDVTNDLLNKVGNGGGFVLSSAGGMSPGTRLENVRAAIEAAKRFAVLK